MRRSLLSRVAKQLRGHLVAGAGAVQSLAEIGADAFLAVDADGLIVRSGAEVVCLGATPETKTVDHAVRQLSTGAEQLVVISSHLAEDLPGIAVPHRCAGALIRRMPGGREAYVAWFRREQLATIRWGGNPTAGVGRDVLGELHPRASFEAFVADVTDRSREWTPLDREAARTIYQTVQRGAWEHEYNGLAELAAIDSLTGLGNRRALDVAIEARSTTSLRPLGLLFLDLDRFKQINDSVRSPIFPARSPAPNCCGADLAMYAAKRDGGSCAVSYTDNLSEIAVKRTMFEREIQQALKDGELTVFISRSSRCQVGRSSAPRRSFAGDTRPEG